MSNFDTFPPDIHPDNYEMKKNPTSAKIVTSDTPDISGIEDMDAEQLRNLIRKVAGAIWGYAIMDDEQKAEAARLKLYNMGMTSSEVHKVVPALDKWFDRTQGKAPQSIAMVVKTSPESKLTDDQLATILANLPNSPMIIPPMPNKLDVVD